MFGILFQLASFVVLSCRFGFSLTRFSKNNKAMMQNMKYMSTGRSAIRCARCVVIFLSAFCSLSFVVGLGSHMQLHRNAPCFYIRNSPFMTLSPGLPNGISRNGWQAKGERFNPKVQDGACMPCGCCLWPLLAPCLRVWRHSQRNLHVPGGQHVDQRAPRIPYRISLTGLRCRLGSGERP